MATGIQASDVWTAADALLRAGEQPTIERVRAQLGRGSPNTVGPHLKAWFRSLGGRLTGEGGHQGDEEGVPAVLAQASQALWALALEQAQTSAAKSLQQAQEALVQREQSLAAWRDRLSTDAARLAQREKDLVAAVTAAQSQAQAAETRVQDLETRLQDALAQLRTAHADTESARAAEQASHQAAEAAAAQHREVLATLQREQEQALREAAQAQREAVSQAEARHAAHERRWLTELDGLRQTVRRLETQRDKDRDTHAAALTQLRAQRDGAQVAANDALRAAAADKAQAESLALRCQTLQESAEAVQTALRQRNDDLAAAVQAWQAQCAALQARLDAAAAKAKDDARIPAPNARSDDAAPSDGMAPHGRRGARPPEGSA